ncbi:hypothetical protein W97_06552 [Coniosporium apollinis CBS 100218]|uniref:DUF6536 domain-containing protein n=1 Tax=Coniosporium apollinis (strain CBS 100218) TaxID=1168221 RepID=R7YZS8_CONA1|nr:uncharacterized protein W97_06552 [Coniosporium apollinis CBS 100218]EON67299.1 hypothetical protein W97_06552 [Coniosporium apollinis CBS 100218]
MSRLSTAYHILINVLSTILLTASNYCMQILCAPTRDEVARAHRDGQGLDIGIISLRNLRYISKRKSTLFLSLALSSIPLHLFYNSAVFGVTIGRHYRVHYVSVNESDTITTLSAARTDLTNEEWWKMYSTQYLHDAADLYLIADRIGFKLDMHANGSWVLARPLVWENKNVINLPEEADVLVVGTTLNDNGTFQQKNWSHQVSYDLRNGHPASHYPGLIPWPQPTFINASISPLGIKNLLPNSGSKLIENNGGLWLNHSMDAAAVDPPLHIIHGLSTPTADGSKVQIALSFMLVVIACNIVKTMAMFLTLRELSSPRILTSGDAVASFLARPEYITLGMCTFGKHAMRNVCCLFRATLGAEPQLLRSMGVSLLALADTNRAFLCTAAIALVLVTVLLGVQQSSLSAWGTASSLRLNLAPQSFTAKGILINSFIANFPQIVLSASYFAVNRLCTSMYFTEEWNSYASSRKGLRVSDAKGEQRDTYFLQLPYRWAVPLAVMCGILHWLLSQSIFLVRLDIHGENGQLIPSESKSACGYSQSSTLVFALVTVGCIVVILLLRLRHIKVGIPIAAHCSLAISAACHPPPDEEEPHLKPVQWGVVRNRFGGEIDHCTYSSEPVTAPEPGKRYA